MRYTLAAALLLVFAPEIAAADPAEAAELAERESNLLVVEIGSLQELYDESIAVTLIDPAQGTIEGMVDSLAEPLGLVPGSWIDPTRPVVVALPSLDLSADPLQRMILALPVVDIEAAIAGLGRRSTGHTVEEGHHVFEREAGAVHVKEERGYLIVGFDRELVAEFDRLATFAADRPAGNVSFDLDLEAVAPLIHMALSGQRASMQRGVEEMKKAREEMEQAGQDPGEGVDTEAMVEMASLYFEATAGLVEEVSRVLLGVELVEGHAILRLRLLPKPGTLLERLLLSGPESFSRTARSVPDEPAFLVYAGNVRMTDDMLETTMDFFDVYYTLLGRAVGGFGELGGPFAELMQGQIETTRRRMECAEGDLAGMMDFTGEFGMTLVQVQKMSDDPDCASMVDEEVARLGELKGPDGEPLVDVAGTTVLHKGARGLRYDIDMAAMLDTVGQPSFSGFSGTVDGVAISTLGNDAESRFVDVVERRLSKKKKGGLTAERFAPLEPAGGIYVAMDFERLNESVPDPEQADDAEAADEEAHRPMGPVILGLHSERDRLAFDVVLPRGMLEEIPWFGGGAPESIWPPPPAPPSQQSAPVSEYQDDAYVSGTGDVTLPVLVHKISPEYPELLRVSRLEGRVIIQAVVQKDGTVTVDSILRCDGKSIDETEPREDLDVDSQFCSLIVDAAVEAIRHWRYEPARKDGKPVDVYFTIRLDFDLE